MFDKQYIGYVKELDFLGAVTSVDFLNDTVTLEDDEDVHVVDREDVEFLKEIGELNGVTIFNKDVLSVHDSDFLIEFELHEDGLVQMHVLDNDTLERKKDYGASGEKFEFVGEMVESLELILGELQGNIYELKSKLNEKQVVDFNIKVVKDFDGKHFTYFYACNNESKGEVDLIKVVFVGSVLLEEKYERRTLSHDVYLDSIKSGTLKEVSIQELSNYVLGLTYGKTEDASEDVSEEHCDCEDCCETETVAEVEEVEEKKSDKCPDCKQDLMVCDCDLW